MGYIWLFFLKNEEEEASEITKVRETFWLCLVCKNGGLFWGVVLCGEDRVLESTTICPVVFVVVLVVSSYRYLYIVLYWYNKT